jgi:hypothetical protein
MKLEYAAFAVLSLVVIVSGLLAWQKTIDASHVMMVLGGAIVIVRSILVESKVKDAKKPSVPPLSSVSPIAWALGFGVASKWAPAALALSLAGCAAAPVCDAVMPTIVTTQSQLTDVQRALTEVEGSGIREKLGLKHREIFDDAIGKIRHGYSVAVQSLALASSACSQPDTRGALALIVDGWDTIRSFLSLVGGIGTAHIADPIVYSEAKADG